MPNMNFRATDQQKQMIESKAKEYGFESVGAYIKYVTINATLSVSVPQAREIKLKDLIAAAKAAYDLMIENKQDDESSKAWDYAKNDIKDLFGEVEYGALSLVQDYLANAMPSPNTRTEKAIVSNLKRSREKVFRALDMFESVK